MLIWKTQDLNPKIASIRYRCLTPVRALDKRGIRSVIYDRQSSLLLNRNTEALIFVKSFTDQDLKLCRLAHQLAIPIILDLCDNIFIENYGEGSKQKYIPRENFREMARFSTSIVTTGPVLQQAIEEYLDQFLDVIPNIYIIPDGCETLEDVKYAFEMRRRQHWLTLFRYSPSGYLVSKIRHSVRLAKTFFNKLSEKVQWARKYLKKNWKSRIKLLLVNRVFFSSQTKQLTFQAENSPSDKLFPSTPGSSTLPFSSQPESKKLEISENTTLTSVETKYGDAELDCIENSIARQLKPLIYHPYGNNPKQSSGTLKIILWFGHHGSDYSQSGIINLLDVAPAIEALSKEIPLCLHVISNSYSKYLDLIAPMPFSTAYTEWHPIEIYRYVSASDVVIIPNSKTAFALSKSANRAVLALSLGTPVVATRIPTMEPLRKCMLFDDWESSLRQYLTQPDLASVHLQTAQTILQANYQSEAIAEQWIKLIHSIDKKDK